MDRELNRLVLSLRELLLGAGTPLQDLQSPQPSPVGKQQQQQQQHGAEDKASQQQVPGSSTGDANSSSTTNSSAAASSLEVAARPPLQQLHSLLDVVADALSQKDQQVRVDRWCGKERECVFTGACRQACVIWFTYAAAT
jgi:hypothetical protein